MTEPVLFHVAKCDSADGEWDLCPALVDRVAVIPRKKGEFTVYLELPEKVAASGVRWGDIVSDAIDKVTKRQDRVAGASRAYEFFRRVYDELTSYGY